MLLPFLLIFFATVSSAVAVYGLLPHWAAWENGLEIITTVRRLQWPLLTLSIGLCLVLLVLVLAGKRKPWWLIGCGPVVALILQLFFTGSVSNMSVVERPPLVDAKQADTLVHDDDWVVGVIFADKAYALPYRQLYSAPVVVLADREKRAAVFWSAYANRVMAFNVNRQFKTRELDIVSMPANALLVYNARVGEFINGVTGLTVAGARPVGLGSRIPAITTTWKQWLQMHPNTQVSAMPVLSISLPVPLSPQFPMRSSADPPDQRVVFFHTNPPVAIPEGVIGTRPLNLEIGGTPVLLFRDPATGRVKGFERVYARRSSRFIANPSRRRAAKGVFMLDVATNSGWNASGVAIDGEKEIIGEKLKPLTNFDEDLYLGVLQHWYADLQLIAP